MQIPLNAWDWLTLGSGLLFLACYLILVVREWKATDRDVARWPQIGSSLGLILLIIASTFPLREELSDPLALVGVALLLVALAAKWRAGSTAATDGDPV